jgi:hypothetical protein
MEAIRVSNYLRSSELNVLVPFDDENSFSEEEGKKILTLLYDTKIDTLIYNDAKEAK